MDYSLMSLDTPIIPAKDVIRAILPLAAICQIHHHPATLRNTIRRILILQ